MKNSTFWPKSAPFFEAKLCGCLMNMTFKKWSALLSVQRVIDDVINNFILSNNTGICIRKRAFSAPRICECDSYHDDWSCSMLLLFCYCYVMSGNG